MVAGLRGLPLQLGWRPEAKGRLTGRAHAEFLFFSFKKKDFFHGVGVRPGTLGTGARQHSSASLTASESSSPGSRLLGDLFLWHRALSLGPPITWRTEYYLVDEPGSDSN